MSALFTTLGRWGGIVTVIVLVIALLRQLIAFVGFLMLAIKLIIVLSFIGVFLLIILAMLRGRAQRRHESENR